MQTKSFWRPVLGPRPGGDVEDLLFHGAACQDVIWRCGSGNPRVSLPSGRLVVDAKVAERVAEIAGNRVLVRVPRLVVLDVEQDWRLLTGDVLMRTVERIREEHELYSYDDLVLPEEVVRGEMSAEEAIVRRNGAIVELPDLWWLIARGGDVQQVRRDGEWIGAVRGPGVDAEVCQVPWLGPKWICVSERIRNLLSEFADAGTLEFEEVGVER